MDSTRDNQPRDTNETDDSASDERYREEPTKHQR